MRDDYEILKDINELLNNRCRFLLGRLNEIRDYIVNCRINDEDIDIKLILEMLD